MKLGLLGKDIGHSMSPSLFSKRLEPLKGSYSLCSCNSLEDISGYLLKDYDGFNVTMPYKSSIMDLLDVLDPEAEEIGAVNTLVHCPKGWKGYNTDIKGIEETLSPHVTTWHTKALILGTGGAARAAAHVLRSWEIWPTFVSRSQSNEDTLRYADLDHRVIQEFLLIINASPVGQRPDVEQRPLILYESIGQEHLVFDMVYNPVKTSFLRAVEQQGAKTLDGMTMLQGQAKASWKLWQQGK